jgi:hypothetical protein
LKKVLVCEPRKVWSLLIVALAEKDVHHQFTLCWVYSTRKHTECLNHLIIYRILFDSIES